MSDAEWDADDFEPAAVVAEKPRVLTDRWDGEDEDEDVKDNWDDEDDSEKKTEPGTEKAVQKKKKKPLSVILAEKEAKRLEEEKKQREEAEALARQSTPAAIAEAKERSRRQQEESDLKLAKEAFGIEEYSGDSIDGANPVSKEEFDKFSESLREKITQFEKSTHYVGFLDTLFNSLCLTLEPEDLKKLGGTLSALANEKIKQQKASKGKKKKKGVALTMSRGDGLDDYTAASYDGFDDFI